MKKTFCAFLCFIVFAGVLRVSATDISAKAAVVINGDTGDILYGKNENMPLPMASTTKIMTALLLCENIPDLEKAVTVNETAVRVEGTSMGLKAGETVKCRDLLYGMLLSSGNDAANAAAIAVSGSIEEFVRLMNKKAADMGLENTGFATPSGLDGEGHRTTAYELALITKTAMLNKDFAAAAATKSVSLKYGTPETLHTLVNHNRLLKERADICGVKTGFTKKAGRCLVTAGKQDGKYVITVTLNDGNDWADHKTLTDLGYGKLKTDTEIFPQKYVYIPVTSGGTVKAEIPALKIAADENRTAFTAEVLPHFVYPPIKRGDTLGFAYYCVDGRVVGKMAITAASENPAPQNSKIKKIKTLFAEMLCRAA